MGQYSSILLIVVMIVAFYLLIIRPQRKRQQQQADMVKTLSIGARVVTNTGIYATVVALGEKQAVLETSPGARITVLKQAVGRVVDESEEDAELGSYRPGAAGTAVAGTEQTGADAATGDQYDYGSGDSNRDDDADSGQSGASGMAGGAPIQEYTPGSGPDFTAPDQPGGSDTHETSPWPSEGHDVSGGSSVESSPGDSSLNGTGDDNDARGDEEADDDRPYGR